MEQTEIKAQNPYKAEARSKSYKWKYIMARNIIMGFLLLLLLLVAIVGWLIRGNNRLQYEKNQLMRALDDKATITPHYPA